MEASTLRPRPCMHASPALAALVLIVEDEAEIADILTAYLEREGLRTLRAADGHSALDLHRSARPDLVLLDVQLPRLDGWSVLTQLRQRGETPVIMLTALDQDLDKLTALRMGLTTTSSSRSIQPKWQRACAPCCGVRCVARAWTHRPHCARARC